jgi:hypothetical protein
MSEKLPQKIFNEEMFYAIYVSSLTESTSVNALLESALDDLRKEGFDVPQFDADDDNYDDNPQLKRLVGRFTKRFEKLTGYIFD